MTTFTVPADTLLAAVAKTTKKGKDSIWSFYLRTRADKAAVYFAESHDAKRINVETIEELRNLYRNFVNAYGYEMITLKK
jgi:hypothetical protein